MDPYRTPAPEPQRDLEEIRKDIEKLEKSIEELRQRIMHSQILIAPRVNK